MSPHEFGPTFGLGLVKTADEVGLLRSRCWESTSSLASRDGAVPSPLERRGATFGEPDFRIASTRALSILTSTHVFSGRLSLMSLAWPAPQSSDHQAAGGSSRSSPTFVQRIVAEKPCLQSAM